MVVADSLQISHSSYPFRASLVSIGALSSSGFTVEVTSASSPKALSSISAAGPAGFAALSDDLSSLCTIAAEGALLPHAMPCLCNDHAHIRSLGLRGNGMIHEWDVEGRGVEHGCCSPYRLASLMLFLFSFQMPAQPLLASRSHLLPRRSPWDPGPPSRPPPLGGFWLPAAAPVS